MQLQITCRVVPSDYKYRRLGELARAGLLVLLFYGTLFNNAEKKIMIISASKERADNMSIFLTKLIIETPCFLIYARSQTMQDGRE